MNRMPNAIRANPIWKFRSSKPIISLFNWHKDACNSPISLFWAKRLSSDSLKRPSKDSTWLSSLGSVFSIDFDLSSLFAISVGIPYLEIPLPPRSC